MNKQQLLALASGVPLAVFGTFWIVHAVAIPLLGEALFAILALCALLSIIAMYIGSLVWVHEDAKKRAKPAATVTFLVAIGMWPIGLLLWCIARPEMEIGGVKFSTSKPPRSSN